MYKNNIKHYIISEQTCFSLNKTYILYYINIGDLLQCTRITGIINIQFTFIYSFVQKCMSTSSATKHDPSVLGINKENNYIKGYKSILVVRI